MTTHPSPRRPDVTSVDLVGGVEALTVELHDYDEAGPAAHPLDETSKGL